MRSFQLISSSIQLLFTTFLMGIGGLCFLLAYSSSFKEIVIECLNSSYSWTVMGSLLTGCSLILFIAFFYLYRRQFYRLSMGGEGVVEIHVETIEKIIRIELEKVYPQKKMNWGVEISRSKDQKQVIEVKTDLPQANWEEQERLLSSIETKLQELFHRQLGYNQEFFLNISFK